MRIFFTGGSGKAGRHAVRHMLHLGHRVINADLTPLDMDGVDNLTVDLTDSGQVFNAMSSYADFDELDPGTGVPRVDAVVHFAAVPRILIVPDNETYRINTISTYNVLEAAVKLGIPKVIFASSETTYGIAFADGTRQPEYLPIDEDHPTLPHDSYGTSKVCNEATARAFQMRSGIDIYGLRISNVIEPHEYKEMFPEFLENPEPRRRVFFSYIDARDLAHIVECCLRTDGLGYEVFNVSTGDHSTAWTTDELLQKYYPDVPVKGALGPNDTLYSSRKAKGMLGFAPSHVWRNEIDDPRG